jgi:hypothetical protein
MKKTYTYKEILDLLDETANSKFQGDDHVKIDGNPELEESRAKAVKDLEDILFASFAKCDMFINGINYIRQYEYMYKHLK